MINRRTFGTWNDKIAGKHKGHAEHCPCSVCERRRDKLVNQASEAPRDDIMAMLQELDERLL